jgi:hypothetical protein
MNAVLHFSQSYAEAREKFITAAHDRKARVFREVHPSERGAQGEELSMDLARVGDEQAPGLLLLSSGTHGVEGFCGSGCQVALLNDDVFLAEVQRAGVAVLMLHAVNPYGFSHLRRVNEDNIDLNRNFVNFGETLPDNSEYAQLHPHLLPSRWPPSAQNDAPLDAWLAKHGAKAYQAAVTAGQYQFADGMFYGGTRPTWSNAAVRAVLRVEASARTRVAWIDFHTGLGPAGHGEKIYAGRNDPAAVARAKNWWGNDVTSFFDGTSSSARLSGVICCAAYDECPRTEVTAIGLEYGTYPLEQVLDVFRAEHWLHNHPEAPEDQHDEIKRRMRDAFYIDRDDWKTQVYAQARNACLTAVTRLAAAAVRA